jgi:hypothetical protein
MKHSVSWTCSLFLLFAFLGSAGAYTALPNDPGIDVSAPLGSTSTFAPGWDSGSWQANGTTKTQFYITPQTVFGRSVTVGEIQSISYWTNKDTLHTVNAADWYLQIYTVDLPNNSTWYGYRIGAEPYFSSNLTETANSWTKWSTDAGNNQLRFFDSSNNAYFGSYTDPFLDYFTSSATYKDQAISLFSIATGSGWAAGFNGYVDGLTIQLASGEIGTVNFEAVPIPGAAWLLGSGVVGLVALKRRRQK